MAVSSVPSAESEDLVEVIELTKAEYRRALKAALDDMGITWRQLQAMGRKGDFVSLRARCLWMMTRSSGSGW